jgi:hypothetical protein
LNSKQGILSAWNLTAAHAIHKKEKEGPSNPNTLPSLGADESNGYKHVPNAISEENRERMRLINKKVFGKGPLYSGSIDPTKEKRGEVTHFADGPYRVAYKMTKRHFVDLCKITYREYGNKPKDREPYNVLLLMVWAFELEPNDIDCIIDIMRHSGKAVESGTPDEFEGVELWPNGGPQMFHTDTSLLGYSMLVQLIYVGGADDEDKDFCRESTHFIQCQRAIYKDLASEEAKQQRRAYLRTIWEKIERHPREQQWGRKKRKVNVRYDYQGDFEEKVSADLKLVVFGSTKTSGTLFATDVLHRAPQTTLHGFAIFTGWQGAHKNLYSDDLPVSIDNFREELSAPSEDESDDDGDDDGDDDDDDDDDDEKHGADEEEEEGAEKIEYLPSFLLTLTKEQQIRKRAFEKHWRACEGVYSLAYSERGIFGEPTAGTLIKIVQAVRFYIGITEKDYLWDWGAGKGKIFHFLHFFCRVPGLRGFGIEKDENMFKALEAILQNNPLPNVGLLEGDSSKVENWKGATIVYNYDGPPNSHVELYFKEIMLKVFRTDSVNVVISTKMRPGVFIYIFKDEKDFKELLQEWAVARIPKLYFGSKSPMQVGVQPL